MMHLLQLLAEPLSSGFFVRAIIGVCVVSVLCALVGVWVVLRGLSYVSDAMSHAVLPGIVGAFLLHINMMFGAIVAAVLTSLGIGYVAQKSGLKQDSSIGIVFVGMFALGVTMLSRASSYATDLSNFLVGNPLGVSQADLWGAIAVTIVVAFVLWAVQKELLLVSFDPIEARAVGLPVRRLNNLLLVLVGLVVVLSVPLVGTTLSVSMLITSSATARFYSNNLRHMVLIAAVMGSVCGILGLYLSYFLDTAAGPTIVLVNTAGFLIALMTKGKKA